MVVSLLAIGAYFLALNAIAFFLIGQDKMIARKDNQKYAEREHRYSEGLFFFLAIVGGSLGIYAGMFIFRHKTQKLYFLIGLPILIIQQLLLLQNYFYFFLK